MENKMKFTEEQIKAMEDKGFKRWTKYGKDRMYVSAEQIGLKCCYYNSGNISGASFNGESISNREAHRMMATKTYIDLDDGSVVSNREDFEKIVTAIADSITA